MSLGFNDLTHLPLVPHICVSNSGQLWFRLWLVAYSAPSHYLNQSWVIVNWTIGNKLQWNFYQNTKLFLHENVFQNIVCEMAAILSRGGWVKGLSQQCCEMISNENEHYHAYISSVSSRQLLQQQLGMHKWYFLSDMLTHCGLVMPYGNIDLDHNWLRLWLVAWQCHCPIHYQTNVNLSSMGFYGTP